LPEASQAPPPLPPPEPAPARPPWVCDDAHVMAYRWTFGGITVTGGGVVMTGAAWLRVRAGDYGSAAKAFPFRVLRTGLAWGAGGRPPPHPTLGRRRLGGAPPAPPRQPRPGP